MFPVVFYATNTHSMAFWIECIFIQKYINIINRIYYLYYIIYSKNSKWMNMEYVVLWCVCALYLYIHMILWYELIV